MTRLFLFFVLICGGCNLARPLPIEPAPIDGGDVDGGAADGASLDDGGGGPVPICRLDLVQPFAGTWSIDAAGFHGASECVSPSSGSSTASMLFRCPDGSSCFLSVTAGDVADVEFDASGAACHTRNGSAELVRTATEWTIKFDLTACDGSQLAGVLFGSVTSR